MRNDSGRRNPLGPWSGTDLVQTARENAGIGADADLPPEVRFIAGVAKLVRRRRAEHGLHPNAHQLISRVLG